MKGIDWEDISEAFFKVKMYNNERVHTWIEMTVSTEGGEEPTGNIALYNEAGECLRVQFWKTLDEVDDFVREAEEIDDEIEGYEDEMDYGFWSRQDEIRELNRA